MASKSELIPEYKGKGVFEPARNIKEYLYKTIAKNQPITRPELVKITGIPRTTIYDSLIKLILAEEVKKYSVHNKKRGRPRIFYEVVRPSP